MPKQFYFGIDVGGTYTKAVLMDERCRIVAKHKIPSKGFSKIGFFTERIREDFYKFFLAQGFHTPRPGNRALQGADELWPLGHSAQGTRGSGGAQQRRPEFNRRISPGGLHFSQIKGIGIGMPGPVDSDRGIVLSLTNIKGWKNIPLAGYLKKFFAIPVFIENDANCMALAESRLGAAKGASFALCLTLGTGVGGGLILNREVYRGPFFLGGEVGHIPIRFGGPPCGCGGRGCLERYVGNRAIISRIKRVFKKNISLEEVSALAGHGNAKALAIWKEVGEDIGFAVSGVVNVFNPEVIVVGGGVSLAGSVLLRSIRKSIQVHAMRQLKGKIRVEKALLGNDAGVLGAALLAKEKIEAGCRR